MQRRKQRSSFHDTHSPSRFRGGRNSSKRKASVDIDSARFVKPAAAPQEEKPYTAKHTFSDFSIHKTLLGNITGKGYVTPTPIQDQSIPHILAGKDLIGIANTGTGKTAAFLLPLIHKMTQDAQQKVLVIVPTRELATQVDSEFREFAKHLRLFAAVCIGGTSMGRQISEVRRRPQVIIGTPGRLADLVKQRVLDLSIFNNIVLDEVDRMLDMGFLPEIRRLTAMLPQKRQSLFFSATMPDAIRELAQGFLASPVTVSVRTRETSANVDQDIIRVPQENNKIDVLHDLLQKPEFEKVLVFIRTKHKTEKIKKLLERKGVTVDSIHGDKVQSKRQRAILRFKQSEIQVLVATDVASRGLDIDGVTHVINFDKPECYEDYIHRIGRTGRGSQKGVALTFV